MRYFQFIEPKIMHSINKYFSQEDNTISDFLLKFCLDGELNKNLVHVPRIQNSLMANKTFEVMRCLQIYTLNSNDNSKTTLSCNCTWF